MAADSLQPKNAIKVTSNDEQDIDAPGPCVLLVGKNGPLNVITAGGDMVSFVNVPNNFYLPVKISRILSGTGADDILALW